MKMVLDTDVVVAGFRSPSGASAELLRLALNGDFQIAVTVALMLEYEAVLTRDEHLLAAKQTKADAMQILDNITKVAKETQIAFMWRPQTRDPADEIHHGGLEVCNRHDSVHESR